MQYQIARGAMSFIANQAKNGSIDTLGVSAEDFSKLTGESPWMLNDRNRMVVTLSAMLNSVSDLVGVPRFQAPAEYVAAGIALFVAPINTQTACRFMERTPDAEILGRGVERGDVVSAQQLFALVLQLVSDPKSSSAVVLFERNTGIRIEHAHIYEDAGDIKTVRKSK